MAEKRYIESRGCENLVYAHVLTDEVDGMTFGEVKDLIGLASISKEVETSTDTSYYDNAARSTIYAEGADTTTITGSLIDDQVLADILGKAFDETTGAFLDNQVGQPPYLALGYKTQNTAGETQYIWKYKGTFSYPTEEAQTKNAGTDRSGTELTFTSVYPTCVFANGNGQGKPASVRMMRLNDKMATAAGVDLAKFFEAVTTPDNIAKTAG